MTPPIQPIVLVGGRSRRFGRDKLREPMGGGWLVDAPIRALRGVFGPVAAAVGECDPEVAARFDRVIADRYPGAGPIGGVLSALEATQCAVLVLAGDLPGIDASVVSTLVRAADDCPPGTLAIMACTPRPEPCAGIYLAGAATMLRQRLTAGERSLHDAIPADRLRLVRVDPSFLVNVNMAADLSPPRKR